MMLNSSFDTKIVDFGLVKIAEEYLDGFSFVDESLTRGVGTLAYMSPEMANEDEYDAKTDVYSFGIVLYYIFVGSLPEQKLRDKMIGKKINLPSPSDSISKFCIDLITKCLSFEPSNRPSFEEILKQIRRNSFNLASCVNFSFLSKRDKELKSFNK